MAMGRMARYCKMEGKSKVIGKLVIEDKSRHLVGRLASRRISRKEFWSWRKKLILLAYLFIFFCFNFFKNFFYWFVGRKCFSIPESL